MDYSDVIGAYSGFSTTFIIILIVSLLLNIGLAFIPASMAKKKGYSFGGFLCLGIFVSFLIALIVAACLQDKNRYTPNIYINQSYQTPPQ